MQAYSAPQIGFLSATLEIQLEFPWAKLSFTLTVHFQIFFSALQQSIFLTPKETYPMSTTVTSISTTVT